MNIPTNEQPIVQKRVVCIHKREHTSRLWLRYSSLLNIFLVLLVENKKKRFAVARLNESIEYDT
jgi:hypothetical protein